MGIEGLEAFAQFGAYGLALWILWSGRNEAIASLNRIIEKMDERDKEKSKLVHECAEVIGANSAAITHCATAMKGLVDESVELRLELARRRCMAPEG